jgi:hypothetical protein
MFEALKKVFNGIIEREDLKSEAVRVVGRVITPKEAIGNPKHQDYPIQKGKERMMQAEFKGSLGQAFTDMSGKFEGKLSQIMGLELTDNFQRAVYVSTVNAVTRHLGMVDRSIHCRDSGPVTCSQDLVTYIRKEFGRPKIALVGLQPRMLEALSNKFEVKVTDLDEDNIGVQKYGVRIGPPQKTGANLEWCDIALVTGTTIVNDTIGEFKSEKPVIFYGSTITGPARLLGLTHFCPYSL